MSRIGKQPVPLPKGVEARIDKDAIHIKGPKGSTTVALTPGVSAVVDGGMITFARQTEDKHARAMYGTLRALARNAVVGVSEGYTRRLEVVGVGYRAQVQGSKVVLNVGFCHTVEVDAPAEVTVTCPDQTHIVVSGIDKQAVGQVAARLRSARKPEPYKGKGVRYEGERIRRKAGKQGK